MSKLNSIYNRNMYNEDYKNSSKRYNVTQIGRGLGSATNIQRGLKQVSENADIWSPFKKDEEHTMYQIDYVDIIYKNAKYRINPIFIQVVES